MPPPARVCVPIALPTLTMRSELVVRKCDYVHADEEIGATVVCCQQVSSNKSEWVEMVERGGCQVNCM